MDMKENLREELDKMREEREHRMERSSREETMAASEAIDLTERDPQAISADQGEERRQVQAVPVSLHMISRLYEELQKISRNLVKENKSTSNATLAA